MFDFFRKNNSSNIGDSNELLADYQSNDPGFIREKINLIIDSVAPVVVSDTSSSLNVLSLIIQASPKASIFFIDDYPLAIQNNTFTQAATYEFSGVCNGIKFKFYASPTKNKAKGVLPVSFNFPKIIEWLQRREYTRIRVPLSHKGTYLECKASELDLPDNSYIRLPIIDLNTNGAAILIPKQLLLRTSALNKIASGLVFLNNGQYSCVNFILKNRHEASKQKMINSQEFGCLFIDLSPQFQTAIQQYIQRIQIEDLRLNQYY